ncbi:MAG: redoxin domain-containing protein [Dehalococcoidia bacterium]|nr:redoxin domain-containing protein [Dehalococcoidia bacterium]MSQ34518.1 redoxin domain-containing protein [Dehalococcoidia bacterium]
MSGLFKRFSLAAVVAAVVLVVTACGSGAKPASQATPAAPGTTPVPTATARPAFNRDAAPAFEAIGVSSWINSEPLTIKGLTSANKVVLVDFWTYTCVNCIRTFPFLREWNAKYADRGLVILGVHTPEFEFEKVRANVERATGQYGIVWPVAQDNDFHTWRAFGNRYWPAKYLIDAGGNLVFSHFGEGSYIETEKEIRAALKAAGYKVDDIPLGSVENLESDEKATMVTRELYGGYGRNFSVGEFNAGQDAYYLGPDRVTEYVDAATYKHDKFYLHGLWKNEEEAVVHARQTATAEDYIALKFAATSVNVVIEPRGPEPFDVLVEMDGAPLTKEQAGSDVKFDAEGRSFFTVTDARLYSVVRLPSFAVGDLKLKSASKNFAVFAFTFGVYESGI